MEEDEIAAEGEGENKLLLIWWLVRSLEQENKYGLLVLTHKILGAKYLFTKTSSNKRSDRCGKQFGLRELNIELSYDPAILLLGTHPEELKARIKQILVYQCSSHHYLQKPKCRNNLNVYQQMKENDIYIQWNIILKRNEMLIHATTRWALKTFMINEISQTHKNTYCMISLTRSH